MDVGQAIHTRYSVRAYKATPIGSDTLEAVLDAARLAPTAANRQAFGVIVVHTEGRQADLKRIYSRDWFTQAPVVVAVCSVPGKAWVRRDGVNYDMVDAAIVMDHLVLAATAAGLGTCWVAAFDPAAAREVLGLPQGVEPIAFTPLGYPADRPGAKVRKALAELVHYEAW